MNDRTLETVFFFVVVALTLAIGSALGVLAMLEAASPMSGAIK